MAFVIGRKVNMDQMWNEEGKITPVTIIKAGPVVITQVRTQDKDGYEAFQVGYEKTEKNITKPLKGHLKNLGGFKYLKEFDKQEDDPYKVGDSVDVSAFKEGDRVKITGIEKGRGFQGVVKRHGFHGSPKTHGTKHHVRAPGSIGSTDAARVVKGKKMAGRMGGDTVTLRKVQIMSVDKERGTISVKGPLPGNKRTLLYIESM